MDVTITWRPAHPDDAPAIAEAISASRIAAGLHEPISIESARELLTGTQWVLDRDTLVADEDGHAVAFGGVSTPVGDATTARIEAAVHPPARDHGLGTHLLSWLVDHTRARHAESGVDHAWSLRQNLVDGDTSARALLDQHGFTAIRHWLVMDRALTGLPATHELAGLDLRAFDPADTEAVFEAHRAAFVDHWGTQDRGLDSFREHMIDASAFRADLSSLAVADDGSVAGYVLGTVDADPTLLDLALVGTRREWRGRGVAGELVNRSLAAAAGAGLERATLWVDSDSPTGAVSVYRRLGFTESMRSSTYALEIAR